MEAMPTRRPFSRFSFLFESARYAKIVFVGALFGALVACQPKGSESGAKNRAEAESEPLSSAPNVDLDGYGESCSLEWGPPPVESAPLSLDGGSAFQYGNDFCGRVMDFKWPLGSGQLDFRALVRLHVPMDFSFWKDVFAGSTLKLEKIQIRLQMVFDGNFGPVKLRQAPTIDLETSAEVSFTQPYNLCTSGIGKVAVSDLRFSTPLGDLNVPPKWNTALSKATFDAGGPIHAQISKSMPGWIQGWINDTLDNLRKTGCEKPIVTRQGPTSKP